VEPGRNVRCLPGSHTPSTSSPAQDRLSKASDTLTTKSVEPSGEELSRLLAAGFVKEVQHPDWIVNLVLLPKKNGKWRMCIDYTNLNKACQKDPFPLPRIDQVVDLTTGCELLCFLDTYSSYHQIPLTEVDQLATTFITPFGCFCYVKMLFRLNNTGSTYQWCM
jgi:hypothetical protein